MLLRLGSYKPYFFCASWLPVRFFSRTHKERAEGRKETCSLLLVCCSCWRYLRNDLSYPLAAILCSRSYCLTFHIPQLSSFIVRCHRNQHGQWQCPLLRGPTLNSAWSLLYLPGKHWQPGSFLSLECWTQLCRALSINPTRSWCGPSQLLPWFAQPQEGGRMSF